jgi:uncharacterized protein
MSEDKTPIDGECIHRGFEGIQALPTDGHGIEIASTNDSATFRPMAKTDFWQKTYYEPVLVADNAPYLYHVIQPGGRRWTMGTQFALVAESNFDQAGLFLRVDTDHWIKAGIEFVDDRPRLSCVVTNGYSDWSTQVVNTKTAGNHSSIRCKLRLHGCADASFVVEAWMDDAEKWEFVRIAHLDAVNSSTELKVGVYAACPTDQKGGCKAVFDSLHIHWGSSFDHKATVDG